MLSLSAWWNVIVRNSANAGWARRTSFSWVMNGANESERSQFRFLTSYFSECRYSSLAADAGPFSHNW